MERTHLLKRLEALEKQDLDIQVLSQSKSEVGISSGLCSHLRTAESGASQDLSLDLTKESAQPRDLHRHLA
jgi:hypothetical protein